MALALAFIVFCVTAAAQTICIDPGHPSENGVGTHGKHISELHAAWVVALKVQKLLEADGYKVVLTKNSENEVVKNIRRAEIANDAHAAYALRLHCDAGTRPGIAVYYPAKQGHVGNKTGPSEEVIKASHDAGVIFHKALIKSLGGALQDRGLLTDSETFIGGKQGGALTGSIYSTVPVVLVEMAVLQNEHDDLFMSTEEGQNIVAKALAAGVKAAVLGQKNGHGLQQPAKGQPKGPKPKPKSKPKVKPKPKPKAKSNDKAPKPKDQGSKPKDQGTKPKDPGSKAKDQGTSPKDPGSKPKDPGSNTKDPSPTPNDPGSNPKVSGPKK